VHGWTDVWMYIGWVGICEDVSICVRVYLVIHAQKLTGQTGKLLHMSWSLLPILYFDSLKDLKGIHRNCGDISKVYQRFLNSSKNVSITSVGNKKVLHRNILLQGLA